MQRLFLLKSHFSPCLSFSLFRPFHSHPRLIWPLLNRWLACRGEQKWISTAAEWTEAARLKIDFRPTTTEEPAIRVYSISGEA
jgi:hypothetical protein